MQQRTLGQQGLDDLGARLGHDGHDDGLRRRPTRRAASPRSSRAHELGVTLFDTAELYGGGSGTNEQLVGRAVKGFRDEMVIATKFGFDLPRTEDMERQFDSRPEHIREVTDNSLRYLGTDHIDVLYQHRVDPDVPIEDVAGTVKELIDAGKVRYFGPQRGRPGHHPPRARRPARSRSCRPSTRSSSAPSRPRSCRRCASSGSASSPTRRSAAASSPATVKPAAEYPEDDMRSWDERWQPGNYERNVEAVQPAAPSWPPSKGIDGHPARPRLAARPGRRHRPHPGHPQPERARGERRRRRRRRSRDDDLARIHEILPEGAYGTRYPEAMMPNW